MKPATIGKVFFAKGGHLFPVTPIVDNFPRNFPFSTDRKAVKKTKIAITKNKNKKK